MNITNKHGDSSGATQELLPVDVHTSFGVETRARRAFLAGQQVGMVFECPDELVIQSLVS